MLTFDRLPERPRPINAGHLYGLRKPKSYLNILTEIFNVFKLKRHKFRYLTNLTNKLQQMKHANYNMQLN